MDSSPKESVEAIALCPVDLLEEGWYAFLLDTMRVAKKSNYEART